jgi:hypothetical protein
MSNDTLSKRIKFHVYLLVSLAPTPTTLFLPISVNVQIVLNLAW